MLVARADLLPAIVIDSVLAALHDDLRFVERLGREGLARWATGARLLALSLSARRAAASVLLADVGSLEEEVFDVVHKTVESELR